MLNSGTKLYRWLAILVFPAGVCLLPALGFVLYSMTESLFWSAMVPMLSIVIFTVIFEHLLPFRADWGCWQNHHAKKNTGLNLLYWLSSFTFQEYVVKAFFLIICVPLVGWMASMHEQAVWWPHDWPLIVQVILLFLISDFFVYWAHRTMHEWHHGWAMHKLHHSLEALNWSSSARMHPLEHFFNSGLRYMVVIFATAKPEVILVYMLYNNCLGFLVHSNINFNTHFFDKFVYTPNYHRFHHSEAIDQSNNNYAGPTLFWDWLFGTLYLPHKQGPVNIGLQRHDPEHPAVFREKNCFSIYWHQFLSPFKYWFNRQ